MLLVSLLRGAQFYIRNFMLITHIEVIVKKSLPTLSVLSHQIELDLHCQFIKLISALRAHALKVDLILQLRELELTSNSSFIKLKFLIFHDYEICITIILQTYFRGLSSGFFKDKTFFLSKGDSFFLSLHLFTVEIFLAYVQ